jgi:DNA-binding GntR family transcriptional regulator
VSSASERAYDWIHGAVSAGRFEAGKRLREEELSGMIGVSRTPIREALRRLSAEGVVEFLPHRGVHVASWTDSELTEIFELRALLESYAARKAAMNIGPGDLGLLKDLARRMEKEAHSGKEDVLENIAELNNEFHRIIANNAGSEQLNAFVTKLVHIPLVYRTFRRYTKRALARSFDHHRELIEAFEVRDGAWAESVMRAHILAARHIFLTSSAGDGRASVRSPSVRWRHARRYRL